MRRTNNAEQVSPSRRSLRRRKRNDHLNDYDVCMNGPGRRGKEYKMCKNLMNSFNECEEEGNIELSGGEEHGNNAQMFGDNAAQGQDQDENQDEAVIEDLKQFLNDNDDCLQVPSGEDEEEWRELRKRFNEAIAHQIASRWHDEGYDIAYEDLFAYAALEQSEQGDPVVFDYGNDEASSCVPK